MHMGSFPLCESIGTPAEILVCHKRAAHTKGVPVYCLTLFFFESAAVYYSLQTTVNL